MPSSNQNRNSIKGSEDEDRTGAKKETGYRKLPDNPDNPQDESISTADNTANGKYSKVDIRKEEKEEMEKGNTGGKR
jgi:hypothetical protein